MNYQEKYDELYAIMANSGDPAKMHIFGEAEKWAFEQMNRTNPDMAKKWLDRIEAVKWDNYLCEVSAMAIVSKFVNQDGTMGAKWNYQQVMDAVRAAGGNESEQPYYNSWALFVVMNWIASNSWKTLSTLTTEDKMPGVVYALALDYLKDPDEPHFIQRYWK
jgi:outer membrane receptor for ferrienterochelin and colicin